MPQPIAYNTGSQTSGSLKLFGIEYAISSSIVSGSNNQRWFSSVNPGNGVVFVTSNYTQSYGTYQASVPLFFTASDYTDSAITGAINGLPDRFGQVPFTTTSSAYAWVQNSGKYFMMNYEYPQIVTDKLILNLDASFLASYPTTGSTWYNLSSGLNAGISGSPAWNSNKGFTFVNGDTSKYVIINPFPMPTTTVSFEMVLKTSIADTGIISYATPSSDNDALIFNPADVAIFVPGGSVSTGVSLTLDGLWKHMVRTSNRTTGEEKLYINGVLRYTGTLAAGNNFNTNGSLVIAQEQDAVGGGFDSAQAFGGNISLSRIYSKVLSQQEVLQNYYQAPIVTDGLIFATDAGNLVSYESGSNTTYSLTGSLTGSLVNGVEYLPANAGIWNFDGTDDYISVPYTPILAPTSAITISTWASSSWSSLTGQRCIISKTQNGGYQLSVNEPSFYPSGLGILFYLGGAYRSASLSTSLIPNGWHYIVSTFDGQYIRLYLDGIERASYNYGSVVPITYNNNNHFLIAAEPGAGTGVDGAYFPGKIGATQVYDRALSAAEIGQNFQAQRSRFGL